MDRTAREAGGSVPMAVMAATVGVEMAAAAEMAVVVVEEAAAEEAVAAEVSLIDHPMLWSKACFWADCISSSHPRTADRPRSPRLPATFAGYPTSK